ncbi:MAG: PAS domain S-box protein [Candidatus Thermoplasmatota archaeon]
MRILYVDNEEDNREQTKMLLESQNDAFNVDTVSSVSNGIEKLKDDIYDVIVSDYDMSPKNVLDLLKKLRESGKDLPFIMFTGKGREEVAMKALNLGADRYIQRQGDLDTVYEFLSRAITQEVEHHSEKRKRRLQETYFQDLFETSPEGIVLLDTEDKIIEVNEAFEKIFQYDREDIKGEKINDLIVPEEKINEANSASRKVLSGDSIMIETRRAKKDGSMIDVSILGYPIEFEEEQVGVFGIYRDISDRKERERKIKNLYRVLSEMERCDSEDEVYDFVIESAKEILDFKSSSIMIAEGEQLVTKKTIAKNVEVGDKEPIDEGIRGLTYQKKESYLIEDLSEWEEAKPTDKDFQSAISIPIGDKGVFQALSYEKGYFDEFDLEMAEGLIFHTEQILEEIESKKKIQKSEEKYRTIFECAGDAIFVIEGYKFIDFNEKTEEIFELEKEDILNRNPWDFSPKRQPDGKKSKTKAKEMIDRALGGEPQFFEWVHEKPDGTEFYTEVSLNRYQIDEEDYVMAVVRDITERKRTKKELEERNEKIRKLHEKATEFEKCESEDEICDLVVETSEEILDFNVCGIDFVEEGEFVPIAISSDIKDGFIRRKVEEAGISRKVYQDKESLLIEDSRDIDFSRPVVSDYRSSITIPLGDFGIYQALSTEIGKFDEKDMELAEIIVNHATEAINRLRFEEALKDKNRKVKRLHDTAIQMKKSDEEKKVYELTVETAKEVLGMYDCTLAIADEENEEFLIKKTYRGEYEEDERVPIHLGYLGKTFEDKSSYLIEDILEDETAKPATEKYTSAISVPIGDIGVFQAMSRKKGYYDDEAVEMAETLLSHTYQVIQRIRGEKELEKSEQKYRSIFENTGTAMVMIEKDKTISLANKKADRLVGFYEKSIEGKKFPEFVVEEDIERIEGYHRERLNNPENVPKEYDFQLLTKNDDVKDIHLIVNWIPGTEKVVASLMDITAKKEMKKAKDRLEGLIQEIDNDFEKIVTYIDSLKMDELKEEQKRNIEKVKEIVEENRNTLEKE